MYGSCSGSCSKICFNPSCRVSESESWRKGWKLRSGEIAELCDSCGSAYEEMRFCEVFHSDTAGWRSCESCGKIMHCGCVASVHMLILLDTGGVECMSCARRSSIIMASNQIWPPSIFLPLYLPESLVDLSGKNYNQITGPNSGSEQWQQPSTLWDAANGGSELYPGMSNPGVDRSNTFALSGDFTSAFAQEKKNIKDLRKEEKIKSLQDSGHLTGGTDPSYPRRGAITNLKTYSSLCADDSPDACVSRDDPSAPLSGVAISFSSPEANDPTRVSGSLTQRKTPQMFPKPSYLSSLVILDSTGESESQIRSARPQGEGQVQNHLLPRYRYWPRITDQELQRISGDSNSVIIPLFEKLLGASDAGRIGQLVLPKNCAEAYFPMISQPEGLPLKVLDVKGKEWVFQFRFWPNNNSRMYVLEGVTPCIQSMQLQEGDIVTFSRIDPEGKLVMGFRKAASTHSEKGILPPKIGNFISPGEEVINGSTKPSEVNSTLSLYSSKGSI